MHPMPPEPPRHPSPPAPPVPRYVAGPPPSARPPSQPCTPPPSPPRQVAYPVVPSSLHPYPPLPAMQPEPPFPPLPMSGESKPLVTDPPLHPCAVPPAPPTHPLATRISTNARHPLPPRPPWQPLPPAPAWDGPTLAAGTFPPLQPVTSPPRPPMQPPKAMIRFPMQAFAPSPARHASGSELPLPARPGPALVKFAPLQPLMD